MLSCCRVLRREGFLPAHLCAAGLPPIPLPFDALHVSCICCRCSEPPELAKDLVPSVMLLPAGRGRAGKKQNRTSSDLSGEQLQSSSLPWGGKRTRGSGLCVLLSPLPCPGPALLSVGHVLLSNTPLFPPDIESNGVSIHVRHC